MISDSENTKEKVNLDTIIVNEIGQFGKFQIKTFILAAIIVIFVAFSYNEYVFTTARIQTRCLIPECDDDVPEWSPSWLPNAIPPTGETTFDNCQRFGNTTSMSRQVEDWLCPSIHFDRNTVQDCEEYLYENTNTVVYDFGLACNEWRRSVIGTIRTLGTFTGMLITGYISDTWGRRVTLCVTAFNRAWVGLLRYWANTSYIVFIISGFMESLLGAGTFNCAYILVVEMMGPRYRVIGGASVNTCFAIGQAMLGLIAWAVPNWRHLTLALYIPQFLTIFCYWVVPESARWYLSKGRFDECEKLLKKAAKSNGKQISDESLKALRKNVNEEAAQKASQEESKRIEPWLIVQVFQHKQILLRVLVTPICWMTTTFIYYGLALNAVNISGNKYLNYVAVSAVEIPGYWTACFLMDRIGRKPVLIVAFWICASFQIAYIFIPTGNFGLSLTVYLIAQYAIATVMATIYVYTAELYPTKHRQSFVSFFSMIGRIGSMIAPLTPAIGAQWFKELPFALFAGFALLSGTLTFLTPETLGIKLPDTFEEATRIGTKDEECHK